MNRDAIAYIQGPPVVLEECNLIHLIEQSGDSVFHVVMKRRDFHELVDRGIGILSARQHCATILPFRRGDTPPIAAND